MGFDFDLFVVGAGSGGVRAARMSAAAGARVAIAEERYLGGTCVNVGCIPKKLFVYGSSFADEFDDARQYGWRIDRKSFDWSTLRRNKDEEIGRLNGIYERLLEQAGVTIFRDHAELIDEHSVSVGPNRKTTDKILIATGSWPFTPDFPGSEFCDSSNELFYLDELPDRIAIIGGGYIAVEFAGIYAGLGVETELVYRGPLFLRGFDEGIRTFIAAELEHRGVTLRFNSTIERVENTLEGLTIVLADGSKTHTDRVLCATGRKPLTATLGLESVGVQLTSNGAVRVDENYRSSVANIYAIGDVIDRVPLTPVAIAEGIALASRLFGRSEKKVDYAAIPTAVFCQPNIGTVGPTEEQAREQFPELQVYESSFTPLKHTVSKRVEKSLMKLLVDGATDRVVAAHMVGAEAGEIIQGLAVAIQAGATKTQFDSTIAVHPTAAEEFVTMREPTR